MAAWLAADLGRDGGTNVRPVQVLTSPLRRAVETADIVGDALGTAVRTDDALGEADCGEMEGRGDPEAWAAHDAVQAAWATGTTTARIDGGESLDDMLARFGSLVRGLLSGGDPDEAVVCIGHGSLYRFVLPILLVPAASGSVARLDVGYAEVIVAEDDRSGRLVEVGRWSGGPSGTASPP